MLERTVRHFRAALGNERAIFAVDTFLLHFDTNNQAEFDQFAHFGKVAARHGLTYFKAEKEGGVFQIFIPLVHLGKAQSTTILAQVAEDMEIRIGRKGNEVHHPITRGEPEFLLEHLTRVPWHRVTGSIYGADVLEPSIFRRPQRDIARSRRELITGTALLPRFPEETIAEWLAHQRRVEAENDTPPRTLLLAEWLGARNRTHAEKALSDAALKEKLPKIFGK